MRKRFFQRLQYPSKLSKRRPCSLRLIAGLMVMALLLVNLGISLPETVSAASNVWTSLGPAGQTFNAVVVDPFAPQTIYAGGTGGAYKTTDGGANWSVINTGLPLIPIRNMAVDTYNQNVLYAGTWGTGMYRSTDGGDIWTGVNTGLNNLYILSLAIDPVMPTTLYVGTRDGVFKSNDAGGHWTAFGLANSWVPALAVDPSSPSTLYASAYMGSSSGVTTGVYKSTNGGYNWTYTSTGLDDTGMTAIAYTFAVDPSASATVYAGTDFGVYKSTDGGGHWAVARAGLPIDSANKQVIDVLAINPSVPTTIYAAVSVESPYSSGVYRSTDGGNSWSPFGSGMLGYFVYSLAFDSHTPVTLYAGTNNGVYSIEQDLQSAQVTLGNLNQTYDGTPKAVTVTTDPAGLATTITYNGSVTAPTKAGSYSVVAKVSDPNYVGSATGTLVISKATATVTLGNLNQTYDGSPRTVTVATNPSGLAASVTYDSSATAPTNAGSYAVVATINDPNYEGSASGTLVIDKALATVTLGNLNQTYDGAPKSASAATTPTGLAVAITYNGSATAPTNAGIYSVIGTVTDPNYEGSATGTLVIAKAQASVTLSNLSQTYDGSGKAAIATTLPTGLAVKITYAGSETLPINAGSYPVVATITDSNYEGNATGTLVINKATATVTLSNLTQTYSGSPKSAIVTTVPSGLGVTITYNGLATTPTNVGSYAVVAAVNDSNYEGSANGTLVINKATATVTLGGLNQTYDGTPKAATATTDPSGLAVTFTYNGSATAPSNVGSYTVVATVNDANYEGSATGTLVIAQAWSDVQLPGNQDGSPTFNLGSVVPIRFQLTGASSGITDLVARIYVAKLTDGVPGSEIPGTSTNPNSDNTFRYDSNTNQYLFNLSTRPLSVGTWQMRIDLGDGATHTMLIILE